jgi:Tol biopolymer transport system component/flagellar hook assembly protein FlgD/subtilase family serine protease
VRNRRTERTLLVSACALRLVTGSLFLTAPTAVHAADAGNVAIIQHDGSPYQRFAGDRPNVAPRQAAARSFFTTHQDGYDFLIVFPTFAYDLSDGAPGGEVLGLHTLVRNDVAGTGQAVGSTGDYGSPARLKGYIDINALVPGISGGSVDTTLAVIAHEMAHQWSGRATFIDSATGAPSQELLGQERAHWSYFLDTNGSVLYGSRWQPSGTGSFTSLESMRRYSALDLYFMGLVAPTEVPPFTLIRPAPGTSQAATDLPPPDGTVVQGIPQTVTIDQVIQAMGPRSPSAADAQGTFRAAFALLIGPGQTATPGQIAFVDSVRREWANRFFFLTRGRGVIETDLIESPPRPLAVDPSPRLGLDFLLARQGADGSWSDDPSTVVRETSDAAAALAAFALPVADVARARAVEWLRAATPSGADFTSRQASALARFSAGTSGPVDQLVGGEDGGYAAAAGYGSTVMDSALVAVALSGRGTLQDHPRLVDFLLSAQSGDGGWPYLAGKPGANAPTAWVLRALATMPRDMRVQAAADAALAFLRASLGADKFMDGNPVAASETAEMVLAFDAWGVLSPEVAAVAAERLLGAQMQDGSWDESVHETALAIQALRLVLTPNLTAGEVVVARASVADGEQVMLTVTIRNTGYRPAPSFGVKVFDGAGAPFGVGATVNGLLGGQASVVQLVLDTTGHAGSHMAFVVADPEGAVDESRRDDNRAGAQLEVAEPPSGADPYVAAGTLAALPSSVDTLPTTVRLTAIIGNLGGSDALDVPLVVSVRGQPVATDIVSLPARGSRSVGIDAPIPAGSSPIVVTLTLDPGSALPDANRGNNTAALQLPVVPSVDLAVAGLTVTPASAEQGLDVAIDYEIRNGGTLQAAGASDQVTVTDAAGAVVSLLNGDGWTVPPGGALKRHVAWRTSVSGSLAATVAVSHPGERNPSDNVATAGFTVRPSTRPNLRVDVNDLVVDPEPVLQGKSATARVNVHNTGVAAAGPFRVAFYRGAPADGQVVLSTPVAGLAPGASALLSAAYGVSGSEDLVVVVVVDPDGQVDEFDESDNAVARTLQVLGLPDVAVTELAATPAFPRQGEQVDLVARVQNVGGQVSSPTSVTFYDGDPAAGGVVIGRKDVPSMAAGGSTNAPVSWTATAGAHRLFALAHPEGLDASTANDELERTVVVQDGAVAATNPYLSPNADGVQDDTEVVFRAASPGEVVLDVLGRDGATLRSIPTTVPAGGGSIRWDGHDAHGRVVQDGTYHLAIHYAAESGGAVIGAVDVVVDDNRSQVLDAVGTASLSMVNLDAGMPPFSGGVQDEEFAPLPDDSGLVQLACFPGRPCDFYLQDIQGGALTPLSRGGLSPVAGTILAMAASPDGSSVAFFSGSWDAGSTLWVYSRSSGSVQAVATGSLCSEIQPIFTPDGAALIYATNSWPNEVHAVLVDGSRDRLIATGLIDDFNLSPDGAFVSLVTQEGWGGTLRLQPVDGGPGRIQAQGYSDPRVTGSVVGSRGTHSHVWSPDGGAIYFIGNESLWTWSGPFSPGYFRVDLDGGDPKQLHAVSDSEWPEEIAASPDVGALVYSASDAFSRNAPIFVQAPPGATRRQLSEGSSSFARIGVSTQGSFIYAWEENGSASGRRAFTTLANLTARVAATRRPGDSFITFQGTATDVNFDRFQIEVRPSGVDVPFRTVASSDLAVVDGTLAQWTPPQAGVYEAVLTVSDKAGNVRARTIRFGWSNDSTISNIVRAPEYISPNGDGAQDATRVSFTVRAPSSFEAQILDAAGTVVRRIPATYLAAGDYSIEWNGLSDAGYLVPDGEYLVRLGGQSFRVVVDTIRPEIEISEGSGLPPAPGSAFVKAEVPVVPTVANQFAKAGITTEDAFYVFSLRVRDDHPGTWLLSEQKAGTSMASGNDALVHQLAAAVVGLSGERFEVRASDLAGNLRVVEQVPSERLFAIALGDGGALDPSLGLAWLATASAQPPYRTVPVDFIYADRISIPANAEEALFCPKSPLRPRTALYYASSISQPIAELFLSYRNPADAEWTTVALEEPSFGADVAAIWNTAGVKPMARFMLHARDITGRTFDSPVVASPTGCGVAGAPGCVGDNTFSAHGVSADVYSAPPDSMWADLVSLTPGSPAIRVAASGSLSAAAGGTAYDVAIDVSSLPDCRYAATFGWAVQGVPRQVEPITFNRCRSGLSDLTVEGTKVYASVSETFPAAVANVDIYASDGSGAGWRFVGRTGPFEGVSRAIQLDTASAGLCGNLAFRLQTELDDGTIVDEAETPSCRDKTVKLACGEVRVASPLPEPPVQRCQSHKIFTAAIDGTSPVPILDLRAYVVSATGGRVGEASISGVSSGTTISAVASISTEGRPDGPYYVQVVAHDASGTELSAISQGAALAESVPPVASITSPAPGTLVCASPVDGGSALLQVRGSATDDRLSAYAVSLREASTGFQVRRFDGTVSTSGSLAALDLQGLAAGDYALGLEARDRAGNASCALDVALRIPGAPQIADFGLSASVIAPGEAAPYGAVDVQASLQDVSDLSLYLTDGSGAKYPVHAIPAPGPTFTWTWDGRLQDGTRAADGEHVLHADVFGRCGGRADAAVNVAIDTLAPTVEITDPVEGAVIAAAGPVAFHVAEPHLARTRVSLGAGRTPAAFSEVATVDGPSPGPFPVLPLSGQPPGEYSVLVEAWDAVGHFGSAQVTFVWAPGTLIDSFDVEPLAVSPNGDGIQDGASALLSLAAQASVTMDLVRGDGSVAARAVTDAQGVQGMQAFSLDAALQGVAEGAYQVRVTARTGTVEQSAARALLVDLTPPSIQVGSPLPNAHLRGSTDIVATVEDPLLRVWQVARRTGGQDLELASGRATVSGTLASLSGLPDGPHAVVVAATDAAGNHREVVVPFVSDSTPPHVAITAPIAGTYVGSGHGPLLVSGTVADQNLARWRLEYGSPAGSDWTPIMEATSPPSAGVLGLWAVPPGASGPVLLRLTATDIAGNEGSTTVAVVIDNTPPVAAIESPRDVSVATLERIRGHISDDNLQSWVLELSDGAPGAAYRYAELARGDQAISAGGDLAVLAGQLPEGPYTARLTVTDKAGNVSTDLAGVFVDRTPPAPSPGLLVALRPKSDAVLTWQASPDADVVGYRVLRAWGDGAFTSIGQGSVSGRSYTDAALRDGAYRYEVVAIDAAGLESAPSPIAKLEVDTTPPAAFLTRPDSGASVHGTLDVVGTASSAADFQEYRLSWGLGASPTSFTLVRRSTAAVVSSVLATIDTHTLPQAATVTLRLEAEDLSGNVAETRSTILIDNDPPAAPVLLSASPQASDVTLKWQATTSPDVLGYLVFRNGAPRVADGVDLSDPTPYLVPAGTTTFIDRGVPDGTLTYQVQAFDRALNASSLSNAINVTLDQHAPSATILSPTPLARLSGAVTVVADTPDLDVASVRIEARSAPSGAFVVLGASTSRPYAARLDPAVFGGVMEIRAIATDKGGRSDSLPQSVFSFYDPPLLPIAVAQHVDQDMVSTGWTDPNPAGRLAAVTIERDGQVVSPANVVTTGTATATATSSGSPAFVLDGKDTTWWQGYLGSTWQLVLTTPALVRSISMKPTGAGVDLYVRVKGAWARVGAVSYQGTYVPTSVALDPPLLIEGLQARVTSVSGSGLYGLTMDPVPVTAAPVVETFTGVDDVRPTYTVTTWGTFGQMVTAQTHARVYRPLVDPTPLLVGEGAVTVTGSNATPNASVTVLKAGSGLSSGRAGTDGRFSVPVTVVAGDNSLQVQATDDSGNRSRLSSSFAVRYEPPPEAAVTLSLAHISGSDVALSFTVAGDTSTIGGFEVVRSASGVDASVGRVEPLARDFLDRSVPNGTFDYRVRALSLSGVPGSLSNSVTVTLTVPPPAAPNLTLSRPTSGGKLALAWTSTGAARFQVERAVLAGSFLSVGGAVTGSTWVDSGLTNGVSYSYRLYAIDSAGNSGPYSNVVTGTPEDSEAPAAPSILEPTVSGSPFTTSEPLVTVAGVAELGARVELSQNGRFAGAGQADLRVMIGRPFVTVYPAANYFDIAPSGEPFAYNYRDAALTERIAVEWPSQGRVVTFATRGGLAEKPHLSPDGKVVAYVEWGPSYRRSVQLGHLEAGTSEALLSADGGGESYLSWSPDGSRLMYLAARTTTDVVVVDLSTRTETLINTAYGGADRPGWLSANAIGYVGGWGFTLVRHDLATGGRTTLAEALGRVTGWTATDDGKSVAALLSDYSGSRVYVIRDTGTLPAFTTGAGMPVFSADGTQLASYAGGSLVVRDVAAGTETVLGAIDSASDLRWPQTGLCYVRGYRGPSWLVEAGRFEIPVRLEAGSNVFVATARDTGGNLSRGSDPIEVTLDTSTLPDLAVSARIGPAAPVYGDRVQAFVTVTNQGSASSGGTVNATLAASDGTVRRSAAVSLGVLAPGESAVAVVPLDTTGLSGVQSLAVSVDAPLGTADRDLSNNRSLVPFRIGAGTAISVAISAQPATAPGGGTVEAMVSITNPGVAVDGVLRVMVVDLAGGTGVEAPAQTISLGAASTSEVVVPLALGGTLAGNYRLAAELVTTTQRALSSTPLTILPNTSAALRVSVDRSSYLSGEDATVDAVISNLSLNAPLDGATVRIEVRDAAGAPVMVWPDQVVPWLWMGGTVPISVLVPTRGLPAGTYQVHASLGVSGVAVASADAHFDLIGRPLLFGAVSVAGAATPPFKVPAGTDAELAFAIGNGGSVVSQGIAARLLVFDLDTGTVVWSQAIPLTSLAPNGQYAGAALVPIAGLAFKVYGVSLLADHDGQFGELLAAATFRVADSLPPTLALQNLSSGMFVRGSVTPLVHAIDDFSGTAIVQVSVDGQPAQPLALISGLAIDGLWSGSVPLPAEGSHALVFSAVDVEGNDGRSMPAAANPLAIQVVSDTVPPVVSISGVVEGTCYAAPVVPVAVASDLNLAVVDTRLNGTAYDSGTPVGADGDYALSTLATDRAGNQALSQVRFVVDRTPPSIYIGGAAEGAYLATDVRYTVAAVDPHLDGLQAFLNGVATAPTGSVTAEGAYAVTAHATDCSGNASDGALHFTIDRTPPLVAIGGVVEGSYYGADVIPTFTAADANLATVSGALNGVAFASGTPVAADGNYLLDVVAVDKAGNRTEQSAAFVIDRSAPAVALSGFVDGSFLTTSVAPSFTVSDANLDHVDATLDGLPFVAGMTASTEGLHVFTVRAQDRAGNEADRTGTFTIDRTPPRISISGIAEGAYAGAPVAVTFSASDAHLASLTATLDNTPFASGALVGGEGSHSIDVVAVDLAGNRSEAKRSFVIDMVPPSIGFLGFIDGAFLPSSVQPDFVATDPNLAQVTATLDGLAFERGTTVAAEGLHTLRVTAADKAGNSTSRVASFTIDQTPPAITVAGVTDGLLTNQSVTPEVTIVEVNLESSATTLDGQAFAPGTQVSAEGSHVLAVSATDRAGHYTARNISFAIDTAPPAIQVTGVVDGGSYTAEVVPVVTVTDAHPSSHSISLDGAVFVSGTSVAADGAHLLEIRAMDAAGNTAVRSVHFTLATGSSGAHLQPAWKVARVLALVRSGCCATPLGDLPRIQAFLQDALGGSDKVLSVTADELEFLSQMRSGLYNVFVLVSVPAPGGVRDDGCGEDLEGIDDLAFDLPDVRTRKAIAREVTELVNAGHAGVIGIRYRPGLVPKYREVLGVDPGGFATSKRVKATAAPFAPSPDLTLSRAGVRLRLVGATEAGVYEQPPILGSDTAVAVHTLGLGRSVTFGFDLSLASAAGHAVGALRRSVDLVTPVDVDAPLAVRGVEITLDAGSGRTVLVSRVPLPLKVVGTAPAARVTALGDVASWQVDLSPSAATVLRLFARLPDARGVFPVTAELTLGSAASPIRSVLSLTNAEAGGDLLAVAQSVVASLPTTGPDGQLTSAIQSLLASVQNRSVACRADVEANLVDLFAAIAATRGLSSNGPAMRLSLDEVIRYWEARWYGF